MGNVVTSLLSRLAVYVYRRMLKLLRGKAFKERPRFDEESGKEEARVLVAFTGAGMGWGFYYGVAAALRDRFDLSNAAFSGISCGCLPAVWLAMDLSIMEAIRFGFILLKYCLERPYGPALLGCEELIQLQCKHIDAWGMTEAKALQASQGKKLYMGVTKLEWTCMVIPRLRPHIVETFEGVEDILRKSGCSMRIPGLFVDFTREEGGHIWLDGGFSAWWSIPDGFTESNTVTVTTAPPETVKECSAHAPTIAPPDDFVSSFFKPGDKSVVSEQFRQGYDEVMRCIRVLKEKGLRELPKHTRPEGGAAPWLKRIEALDVG